MSDLHAVEEYEFQPQRLLVEEAAAERGQLVWLAEACTARHSSREAATCSSNQPACLPVSGADAAIRSP